MIVAGGGLRRHGTCDAAVRVFCQGPEQQIGARSHGGAIPPEHCRQ